MKPFPSSLQVVNLSNLLSGFFERNFRFFAASCSLLPLFPVEPRQSLEARDQAALAAMFSVHPDTCSLRTEGYSRSSPTGGPKRDRAGHRHRVCLPLLVELFDFKRFSGPSFIRCRDASQHGS